MIKAKPLRNVLCIHCEKLVGWSNNITGEIHCADCVWKLWKEENKK